MSSTIRVFDPALCCSTGVCGPEVDVNQLRFAADLEWLRGRGVEVARYNLGQEPNAFAADPLVRQALQREGMECLPLIVVGGRIASRGQYPDREALLVLLGAANSPAGNPAPDPRHRSTATCGGSSLLELGGPAGSADPNRCC
jgi:hypothetical protein